MNQNSPDLGLYIHWPFCLSKCPYCDFNSHVVATIDEGAWHQALSSELAHMAELCEASSYGKRPLTSIFIGGGTPSLMPVSLLASLITQAETHFGFTPNIEITAEANPTSVETAKLQGFYDAGVNRISLGVQALDDDALAFLGRGHSAKEAIAALDTARQLFDRLSVDLIYGRAGQSAAAWEKELTQALSCGLDHLSLYQLTIEQGTQFYTRHKKGEILNLGEDDMADLYEVTEAHITDHDMACYEISNYAKQGAESRHNLIYWRTDDWIGIGPGAFGRMTMPQGRQEIATRRSPAGWLSQTSITGNGIDTKTLETDDAIMEEIFMMGLRAAEGVPLSRLTRLTGAKKWPFAQGDIASLCEAGWLICDETRIRASFEGRLRLNYILQTLLAS